MQKLQVYMQEETESIKVVLPKSGIYNSKRCMAYYKT